MGYVQAPLGTPSERERRPLSLAVGGDEDNKLSELPLKLYDSDEGGFVRPLHARWSDHYRTTRRRPDDTFPAPWVLSHYMARAIARLSGARWLREQFLQQEL